MFGVEGESERPEKRRRLSEERDDEDEEEMLERSGVFDEDDPGGKEQAGAEELPRASSDSDSGAFDPSEEGRRARVANAPYVPSDKERREHDTTHYPPRSWCPHCVEGRGLAAKHSRSDEERVGAVGDLHFDYCFLSSWRIC